MTSYTSNYALPHPTGTLLPDGAEEFRDDGNGARDIQSLAEAVDRQLDRVNVAWVGELDKPAEVCRLAIDETGIAQLTEWTVFTDTNLDGSGGMGDTDGILANSAGATAERLAGWYHIIGCLSSIPSGGITGNFRKFTIQIAETGPGGTSIVEEYNMAEFEFGGGEITGHVSFVTYLDSTRQAQLAVWHNNPTSTLTVKNTATLITAYRISTRT